MKGRRLWMRVQTAAGELRVYATTLAVENDDGEACDATFDPDTHTRSKCDGARTPRR